MLECLIIGDSIAVGVGSVTPKCETIAKVGINSKSFEVHHTFVPHANTTVISLGSNDGNADFGKYLRELRSHIHSHVVWILPRKMNKSRIIVLNIARQYGDSTVNLSDLPSSDGIHPKNYHTVAGKIF